MESWNEPRTTTDSDTSPKASPLKLDTRISAHVQYVLVPTAEDDCRRLDMTIVQHGPRD